MIPGVYKHSSIATNANQTQSSNNKTPQGSEKCFFFLLKVQNSEILDLKMIFYFHFFLILSTQNGRKY